MRRQPLRTEDMLTRVRDDLQKNVQLMEQIDLGAGFLEHYRVLLMDERMKLIKEQREIELWLEDHKEELEK